jgi:hypothetical protein
LWDSIPVMGFEGTDRLPLARNESQGYVEALEALRHLKSKFFRLLSNESADIFTLFWRLLHYSGLASAETRIGEFQIS